MKILSIAAIKGGVGKTTLTFNFGEWLAEKGNNILYIDLDHQCNLTQTYDIYMIVKIQLKIFSLILVRLISMKSKKIYH